MRRAWWFAMCCVWDDCIGWTIWWTSAYSSIVLCILCFEGRCVADAFVTLYSVARFVVEMNGAYWRGLHNVVSSVLNRVLVANVRNKDESGIIGGLGNRRDAGFALLDRCRAKLRQDGWKVVWLGDCSPSRNRRVDHRWLTLWTRGRKQFHGTLEFCGKIRMVACGEQYRDEDAFVRHYLNDEDGFELMLLKLLTSLLLRPVFCPRISILLWWPNVSVLHEPCSSILTKWTDVQNHTL